MCVLFFLIFFRFFSSKMFPFCSFEITAKNLVEAWGIARASFWQILVQIRPQEAKKFRFGWFVSSEMNLFVLYCFYISTYTCRYTYIYIWYMHIHICIPFCMLPMSSCIFPICFLMSSRVFPICYYMFPIPSYMSLMLHIYFVHVRTVSMISICPYILIYRRR